MSPCESSLQNKKLRRSFWSHISTNKTNTILLVFFFTLLLAGTTGAFCYLYAPEVWWVGSLISVAISIVYFFLVRSSGAQWVLNIAGARPATWEEHQQLVNIGEEIALAAGISMPKLYVIDDPSPNAFAVGWNPRTSVIAFTSGILGRLNRDELQGVMAHEMAHIRNHDNRLMMTLALSVGLLLFLRDAFLRGSRYRIRVSRSGSSKGAGLIWLILAVVIILAPLFGVLLKMAVSRQREFLADATAVQFTRNPSALASALQKLAEDIVPSTQAVPALAHMYILNPFDKFSASLNNLFSTHPPVTERIRRLQSMGASLEHNVALEG